MQSYHLARQVELATAAITPLRYGRYLATVEADGTVVCDKARYLIDSANPPLPGEKVLIWCCHDLFCCLIAEYEATYHHSDHLSAAA